MANLTVKDKMVLIHILVILGIVLYFWITGSGSSAPQRPPPQQIEKADPPQSLPPTKQDIPVPPLAERLTIDEVKQATEDGDVLLVSMTNKADEAVTLTEAKYEPVARGAVVEAKSGGAKVAADIEIRFEFNKTDKVKLNPYTISGRETRHFNIRLMPVIKEVKSASDTTSQENKPPMWVKITLIDSAGKEYPLNVQK